MGELVKLVHNFEVEKPVVEKAIKSGHYWACKPKCNCHLENCPLSDFSEYFFHFSHSWAAAAALGCPSFAVGGGLSPGPELLASGQHSFQFCAFGVRRYVTGSSGGQTRRIKWQWLNPLADVECSMSKQCPTTIHSVSQPIVNPVLREEKTQAGRSSFVNTDLDRAAAAAHKAPSNPQVGGTKSRVRTFSCAKKPKKILSVSKIDNLAITTRRL